MCSTENEMIKLNVHKLIFSLFLFVILASLLYNDIRNKQVGIASWYGGREKLNKYTASGEIFNRDEFTCASWNYPFGTLLKVTNLRNSHSVVVRVNDRGPARRLNRIIDLSQESFKQIALLDQGITIVKIEVINHKSGGL